MGDSHMLSHHVLDSCILDKVASQVWEKELLGKFQKPYLAHLAKSYSTHMYMVKQDGKLDDGVVTPKKAREQGAQQIDAVKVPDSQRSGSFIESRDSFESTRKSGPKSQGRYLKPGGA